MIYKCSQVRFTGQSSLSPEHLWCFTNCFGRILLDVNIKYLRKLAGFIHSTSCQCTSLSGRFPSNNNMYHMPVSDVVIAASKSSISLPASHYEPVSCYRRPRISFKIHPVLLQKLSYSKSCRSRCLSRYWTRPCFSTHKQGLTSTLWQVVRIVVEAI